MNLKKHRIKPEDIIDEELLKGRGIAADATNRIVNEVVNAMLEIPNPRLREKITAVVNCEYPLHLGNNLLCPKAVK